MISDLRRTASAAQGVTDNQRRSVSGLLFISDRVLTIP